MTHVFVSYAREDRARIACLVAALEATGHEVWWDRKMLGGDDFTDEIERALQTAGAVIVAWSAQGAASRWVRDEAGVAADAGKLVAITMDGSLPPLGFRQFHAIDLSQWPGDAGTPPFTDVTHAIAQRLAGERPRMQGAHAPALPVGNAGASTRPEAGRNIIAVLPFANRSPLPDDAFFADGVHDELLTQLAQLSALQVISRTSMMRYRDTLQPVPEIARELGATVVVEGAVQRAGKRVRINVQLIDGVRDTHLWAQNFDRELTPDNLFDIQSEITRAIADRLHATLTGSDEAALTATAPTRSLAAYDAYLRGHLLLRSEAAGEAEMHRAVAAFDEALAADAEFAAALAGKARALLCLYWFFGWDPGLVDTAGDAIQRAKALAPDTVDTLLAEAYYHYWGKLDYAAAEAALNRVLVNAPNNAEALACKAYVIRRDGRFSESIGLLQQARRLNPMLVDLSMELATTLATFGQFAQANALLAQARTLDAQSAFTAYYAGDIGYLQGRADLAWEGASIVVEQPDFVYFYRRAFHGLHTGNADTIRHALDDWQASFHQTAQFPLTFDLYQAMALQALQQDAAAAALLDALRLRAQAMQDPYPGGWKPDAPYFPVTLPGLLRDRAAVHALVAAYEREARADAFGRFNHYHAIAAAFARAGDPAAALDYLEKLADLYGPQTYLAMAITPEYGVLRAEPRYLALAAACEAWAKRNTTD